MGYSQFGACFTVGFSISLFLSIAAGSSVAGIFGALGAAATPFAPFFFTFFFGAIAYCCGYGKEKYRPTPAMRWDEQEAVREEYRQEVLAEREKARLERIAEEEEDRRDNPKVKRSQIAPEPMADQELAESSYGEGVGDDEGVGAVEDDAGIDQTGSDEEVGGGGKNNGNDSVVGGAPGKTVDDDEEGSGAGDEKSEDDDVEVKKSRGCCIRCLGCCCACCMADEDDDSGRVVDEFGCSPATPRPDPKPVQNCLHNGFPSVLGSWVADLHIVFPNSGIISVYLKQRSLMEQIEDMRSTIQQFKSDTTYKDGDGANPKKQEKSEKKLEKLMKKIGKTRDKVAKSVKDTRKAADCEGCFITFNHEESQQRCLDDYRASNSKYGRFFQPKHLRFMWHKEDQNTGLKYQTLTSLRVTQASEPSDIFWENLTTTDGERMVRVVVSNTIMGTILILAFAIAVLSSGQTKIAMNQMRSVANCDALPATWYGRYYNKTPGDLWVKPVVWVRNKTYDQEVCDVTNTSTYFIVNSDFDLDPFSLPRLKAPTTDANPQTTPFSRLSIAKTGNLCSSMCVPASSSNETCGALSCQPGLEDWDKEKGYACFGEKPNYEPEGKKQIAADAASKLYYPKEAVTNCYCKQVFDALGGFTSTPPESDADVCTDFFSVLYNAAVYGLLAVVSVAVVNGVSKPVINACIALEKQASVSEEKKATVAKMFSLQFLNTAVIVLVVNTAYSGSIPLGPLQQFIGTGEYPNFNAGWYATIGLSIAQTMLVQICVPHQGTLAGSYAIGPLKRLALSGSVNSQEKLNDLYEGENFMIEARAAFTAVSLIVTLMYSTGIPALTVFGFFNFLASYFVDKWLLLYRYKKPPMYGPAVPMLLVNLLPLGTFLHMVIGIYMLSNKSLVYGPDITAEADTQVEDVTKSEEVLYLVFPKLIRFHTLVLFLIFAGYSVLFVLFIFGMLDDFAESVVLAWERTKAALFGNARTRAIAKARSYDHEDPPRPAYCDPYVAPMTTGQKEYYAAHKKLLPDDKKRGYRLAAKDGSKVTRVYMDDTEVNGVKRKKGSVKYTWEHIKDSTAYTYDVGMNINYRTALLGIKSNGLPCPSRKMRLEDENKMDLYGAKLGGGEEDAQAAWSFDDTGSFDAGSLDDVSAVVEQDPAAVDAAAAAQDEVQPAVVEEGAFQGDIAATEPAADAADAAAASAPADGAETGVSPAEVSTVAAAEAAPPVAEEAPAPKSTDKECMPEAAVEPEAAAELDVAAKAAKEEEAKASAEEQEREKLEAEAKAAEDADEAERAKVEAEASAQAAQEEAARQAADAAASAKAAEEAAFAAQKADAKAAAEARAEEEAKEAARLQAEAEAAENMVVEEDEDAEEL